MQVNGSNHSPVRFKRRGALERKGCYHPSRFRKACRSRFPTHSPGAQKHPETARTCFEGPFGELLRATGPMAKANPFRWSTQYQDDETDLVCYLHRYYNPSTGRWLSRDPIGEEGNMGLYGFVGNQPINLVDVLGLQSWIGPGYGALPTPGLGGPTAPGSSTATIGGWGLGFNWLLGTSQPDRHFGDGDYMTGAMKNSDIMKLQRDVIGKDIANYCHSIYGPPYPYVSITRPLGGELGGIPEGKYVAKFFLVQLPFYPAEAYTGSWSGGYITTTYVDCCKRRARIHVHALNVSGASSATRFPPSWGGYSGGPSVQDLFNAMSQHPVALPYIVPQLHNTGSLLSDNPFGTNSYLNTITQTYDWDEEISF